MISEQKGSNSNLAVLFNPSTNPYSRIDATYVSAALLPYIHWLDEPLTSQPSSGASPVLPVDKPLLALRRYLRLNRTALIYTPILFPKYAPVPRYSLLKRTLVEGMEKPDDEGNNIAALRRQSPRRNHPISRLDSNYSVYIHPTADLYVVHKSPWKERCGSEIPASLYTHSTTASSIVYDGGRICFMAPPISRLFVYTTARRVLGLET
jgi:hypothetical protein